MATVQEPLPAWLFPIVAAVVAALTRRGAPTHLLVLDLIFVLLPGGWVVAGIMVNPTDLVFAGIITIFLRRGVKWQAEVPMYRLWILLGVLQSLAYVHAPQNHEYLTDPLRAVYQLYRYCWKPILYYPISAILLADRRTLDRIWLCLLLVADAASLQGVVQGFQGARASGPFAGTNALGGVLLTPMLVAGTLLLRGAVGGSATTMTHILDWVLFGRRSGHLGRSLRPGLVLFYGISILLMARALVFSNSRGAFVALLAGVLLCTVCLWTTVHGRGQVVRTAAVAVLLVGMLLAVRPSVLEGPNVQRLASVSGGTDVDNFRWRLEQRWPHFTHRVLTSPLLGFGTEVDPALGAMNTPHNGYLALALVHGIPAASIFVFFGIVALHTGLRVSRDSQDPWERSFGLGAAASILGLLIHNLVDATFLMHFVACLFWMLVAAMLTARRRADAALSAPARTRPSRPMRGGARGRVADPGVRLGGRTA